MISWLSTALTDADCRESDLGVADRDRRTPGNSHDRPSDADSGQSPPAPERRPESSGRGQSWRAGVRGQTTFDFAVGMSIFLLSLSFVFLFVPGMLAPFGDSTQAETPAANRVAEDLVTRTLGDADEPYLLDGACTAEFFNDSTADCRFDGDNTAQRVGVVEWKPVNVTIRGDRSGDGESDVLCWDPGTSQFVERGDGGCDPGAGDDDVVLSRGAKPSGSGGETVSAHRVALLDGTDVTVEVVMW